MNIRHMSLPNGNVVTLSVGLGYGLDFIVNNNNKNKNNNISLWFCPEFDYVSVSYSDKRWKIDYGCSKSQNIFQY